MNSAAIMRENLARDHKKGDLAGKKMFRDAGLRQ